MSIPLHCSHCGYRGFSQSIQIFNGRQNTFAGGIEGCPRCRKPAALQSGTYDHDSEGNITAFVSDAIEAFRSPSMTREKVAAFRSIAQQVQTGNLAPDKAREEIAKHSSGLAKVWDWVGENERQLQVLLIVIGLFLAHYHFVQMSAGAAADLEVRRSAVQADRTNAQATERNAQALEKIGEELAKMNLAPPSREPLEQGLGPHQRLPPAQTTSPKNRAERRKAAAVERRAKQKGG
jgi:hypothetical protein